MEALWRLLLLSVAMLIGSYIAGSIPLAMTLAEDKLKLVSVLGAGLLVGTALAVIIPEGVHTLYSSQPDSHHGPSGAAELTKHITGSHSPHHDHQHEGPVMEMHSLIGVALVLGFIFMLLIDQISGGHSHTSHDPESTQAASTTTRNKMTVTLGLVVHAAADGVALGAAASTSQAHVEIIVFIAIMLHKAPAAFGLVSFLMHEGLERSRIRKHLAIFSGAAPTLAIGTYIGLSQQSRETLTNINATGLAMLFSAGTFLYVATVHVLPEIQNMGTTRSTDSEGNVVIREQKGFKKLELCAMVTGALLPLVLALGHHH